MISFLFWTKACGTWREVQDDLFFRTWLLKPCLNRPSNKSRTTRHFESNYCNLSLNIIIFFGIKSYLWSENFDHSRMSRSLTRLFVASSLVFCGWISQFSNALSDSYLAGCQETYRQMSLSAKKNNNNLLASQKFLLSLSSERGLRSCRVHVTRCRCDTWRCQKWKSTTEFSRVVKSEYYMRGFVHNASQWRCVTNCRKNDLLTLSLETAMRGIRERGNYSVPATSKRGALARENSLACSSSRVARKGTTRANCMAILIFANFISYRSWISQNASKSWARDSALWRCFTVCWWVWFVAEVSLFLVLLSRDRVQCYTDSFAGVCHWDA